jgi:glycosyltransferase XagB
MAAPVPFKPVVVANDTSAPARVRRLGETLLESGAVAHASLDKALDDQQGWDAPLGRLLLAQGAVSAGGLRDALAAQANLPVVDLSVSPPEPSLLAGLDPYRCLALEALPWRQVGRTRVIAVSRAEAIESATAEFGGGAERVAPVIADADDIRRAIISRFSAELRDGARLRCPSVFSCRSLAASGARPGVLAAVAACLAATITAPAAIAALLLAWTIAMNSATTALRLFALVARLRRGRVSVAADVPRLSAFQRLPTVSILAPLKGEAAVAGELIRALKNLDYPPALLDIKLILEEEDLLTRIALDRADLPVWFEILTVPKDKALQTKPRAMNFALPFCRGTIIGVYDAEDRPDPQQIRAVVQALADAPPDVACVQGYLDFYNPTQNLLARCFTIEYAIWFRVLLHGVQRLRVPIPLGGTSVFFRRRALEAVGGWDAHNVTEDADLGMRLARFGYRCEMIRSVTLEEANCHPWRWIGQRSRWLKGYALTWLTHMRSPRALLHDLGWRGFLGFQVLFLGGMTSYLAIPLFWFLLAAPAFGANVWDALPPSLFALFIASMVAGQAVMISVAAVALHDCGRKKLLPWLLLLPYGYWPLGAVAAYRAVWEAIFRPFHWTKTQHGLATQGVEQTLNG